MQNYFGTGLNDPIGGRLPWEQLNTNPVTTPSTTNTPFINSNNRPGFFNGGTPIGFNPTAPIRYSSAPWDTTLPSMRKRDIGVTYEPWEQWGKNNLQLDWNSDMSKYFGDSWAPWASAAKQGASDWSDYQTKYSSDAIPIGAFQQDLNGLQWDASTLEKLFADKMYYGKGYGDTMFGKMMDSKNDPYMPTIVTAPDGSKYVRDFQQKDKEGGFLDKITGKFETALALSGFAGLGTLLPGLSTALSTGAGLGIDATAAAGAMGGQVMGGLTLADTLGGLGLGAIGEGMGLGIGGAMDMGVGGIGEAMGLDAASWGANLNPIGAGGAMDMGVGGVGEAMGLGNQTFGLDPSMWSDVAQGWEGLQAGSAAQNAALASNPLQQIIEQLKTAAVSPTTGMSQLAKSFLNRKDPLLLLDSVAQYMNNKKNANQMEKTLKQFQQDGFPHKNFYQLAQEYLKDPAKRMAYLQGTPGFMASQDYATNAQKRRNARTGDLSSGYGDALMTSAVGQHAMSWDKQLWDQIAGASGIQFNPMQTNAQLATAFLPAMQQQQSQGLQAIFEGIRNNQGYLPAMLQTVLA